MRIKKLEICGFKSFKDKTVIHFDAGITGIVGPNGCGKSNIVDALVWVMGEMSAKHLRGSSMEDVIFAGSQDYAPVGLAEVSLTLENDGGPFPVQYLNHSEVMVTRRLQRTGESEYLINKEPARLRDIQEIFMDTGAGSRGFSIIEQGQIGKIITSKPHDRRNLIEEAAGITKFKVRKKESERKLKATEQNLIRLADIVTELKRQMDSLQRQAEKAERFKKIKDEVTDKEMWMFSTQYKEHRQKLEDISNDYLETKERDTGFEAHHQSLDSNWAELKTELALKQTEIEDLQLEFKNSNQTIMNLEKEIREAQFEIEQAKRSKEMTGSFVGQYQARQQALLAEVASVEVNFQKALEASESAKKFFEESQSLFDEASLKVKTADEALTEKSKKLILLEQSQIGIQTKVESLKDKEQELREEKAQTTSTHSEIETQKKEFEKRRNNLFSKLESEKQMQLDLSSDLETLKANIETQNKLKEESQLKFDSVKEELSQVSSLLYSLENLQKNMEGYDEGVKEVLSRHKDLGLKTLSDVIDVPADLETAFSSAVGVKLQTLVSPNLSLNSAEDIFKKLLDDEKGRVSFFVSDLENKNGSQVTESKTLFDLVTVQGAFEKSLKTFLSQIFLVTSSEEAKAVLQANPRSICVTKTGEVYDSLGFVAGGSVSGTERLLLQRKREIKELFEKQSLIESSLAGLKSQLKVSFERVSSMEEELEAAKEQTTSKEIEIANLKKDFEQAEYELKNTERSLEKHDQSLTIISEKWNKISEELKILTERQVEESSQIATLKEEVSVLEKDYKTTQDGIEGLRQKATATQVEFASKAEQMESIKNNLEKLNFSLAEVESEISSMTSKSEESVALMTENEVLVERQKVQLDQKIEKIADIEKRIANKKDEYEGILSQEKEAALKVSEVNLEKSQISSKIKECELQMEQLETRIQFLKEQSQEKYLLDLEEHFASFIDKFDIENKKEIDAEVKDLRAKISRIGEVNISAIREYEDISGRYTFLSEQQEDLLKAKDQLRKVIDRINRICTRRFRDTFEAVNERFTKVFPVLFGGGEARLVLVENEDESEPGIDIVSKPPGKKMQNVSLLSGGEKALTAVSLIFSIFLVKPSPFCLLDEVDAPLDDANVFRFNDLVKEMAKRSQIIIVTHNKNTMAVNNKLYGVTMQEKGVSKMVSVDLDGSANERAANA